MKQPNKALIKIIKRKADRIVKLEKEYWKTINEQRDKFGSVDEKLLDDFEKRFPSDKSSLIYGCVDGVVIIRHTAWDIPQTVKIEIVNSRLSILLKQLPVPINNEQSINFSPIVQLGVGTNFRMINSKINDIQIDNLQISVFSYSNEDKLDEWEDAMTDIKLAILGLNSGVQESGDFTEEKEKSTIIEKLKLLKTKFEELLANSTKEEELQIFLKNNPILIQHYSKIYPKQKLGDDFITDFVFASTLDQGIKYTFVEIERVSMPIFTKAGEFTAGFKHADKQTLDWEIWLESNKDYLSRKLVGLETPNFMLIAGRSNNFSDDNKALLRAWNRRQNNMEFLSYDDILFKLIELINNLEQQNKTTHNIGYK